MAMMNKEELLKMLLEKTSRSDSDSCWIWTGGVGGSNGYGTIFPRGKMWYVHRLSWYVHNDKIPEGLLVCHKCDNPRCWNPDHLFIGTQKDNMLDCVNKGRHRHSKERKRKNITYSRSEAEVDNYWYPEETS